MYAKRHLQLKERLGIKPPPLAPVHTLADSQPEQPQVKKLPPLESWHYDPQLFRKWPQVQADNAGAGDHLADREEAREVSLGL